MKLTKPIMIVCAGRSGSTMYYRLVARHRDVGWLSTFNQKFPSQTWLSVFSRLYRHEVFKNVRDKFFFPKPFSAYNFWGRHLPGITRHDRPLTADDVPEEAIEPLRRQVQRVMKYQGKKRFLMKVTGWARIGYFNRVFPDARFIYLRRQSIAVVASWLKAGWLNVDSNIDGPDWEWGEVPEQYRQVWKELGGTPALSAAVKTQIDVDDLRRNIGLFPERSYELDYENLVKEPMRCFRETLDFCELDWSSEYEQTIRSANIRDFSDKWKQQISPQDAEAVREFFKRVDPTGDRTTPGADSALQRAR